MSRRYICLHYYLIRPLTSHCFMTVSKVCLVYMCTSLAQQYYNTVSCIQVILNIYVYIIASSPQLGLLLSISINFPLQYDSQKFGLSVCVYFVCYQGVRTPSCLLFVQSVGIYMG